MKKEDVFSIALKAGFKQGSFKASPIVVKHSNGSWVCVSDELQEFAKLVEQETLERAAAYFDARGKDKNGEWSTGSYDADSPGIILRSLKGVE